MDALRAWLFALVAPTLATGSGLPVQHLPGEPPPFVITGNVRDRAGAEAAGVQVALYPGGYPGAPKFAQAITDANGRYALTVHFNTPPPFIMHPAIPRNCIMARDPGKNLATIVEIGWLPQKLDLDLKPGLRLSGSLKDPAGKPLENIPLDLGFQSRNEWFKLTSTPLMTDAAGAFTVYGLPQGMQYIVINEDTPPGYGTVGISLNSDETAGSEDQLPPFVLKRADRKLAGQVVGPDGEPVPGAKVVLKGDGQPRGKVEDFDPGEGQQTTTDALGNFSFGRVCEGTVQIAADGMDSEGWSRQGGVRAHGGDMNVSIRFPINVRFSGLGAKFVRVSGRVLDPSGVPVPGVRICCTPQNYAVTSDAEGKYSITWIHEDYGNQLWVHMQDFQRHLALNYELQEKPVAQDLHLLPALTLAVKVQDANGKPITTAHAGDLMTKGGGPRSWWGNPVYAQADGSNYGAAIHDGSAAIADSQGVIRIPDLPQRGYYRAVITAPGYGAAAIEAQPELTDTNRLELPPVVLKAASLSLAGRLLNAGGVPVPNFGVSLGGGGQAGQFARTDDTGHFIFNSVCAGAVQLCARIPNSKGTLTLAFAQAHAGDTNVTLRVPINGTPSPESRYVTVSGRVLDTSGAPLAGAFISCPPIHSTNKSQEITSGTDGRYSLMWISETMPGASRLWVHVQDFQHHLALGQELYESAPNTDLWLQPALTLSVKVQGEDGRPISAARADDLLAHGDNRSFYLYDNADRHDYYFNAASRDGIPPGPDGQGVIQVRDLPPWAEYSITVAAPGYGAAILIVKPADGRPGIFQFPLVVLKKAGLKLSGTVVSTDGEAVGGVELRLRDFRQAGVGQPDAAVTTDEHGAFCFPSVCEGPARVFIDNHGMNGFNNSQTDASGGQTGVIVKLDTNAR